MNMEESINKRLEVLEKRNIKVDADKAWELSKTRRLVLMLFTYVSIGLYLSAINIQNPWENAIVPSVGFFLSTLTLPFIKKLWLKYLNK